MKAVVLTGKDTVEIIDSPRPHIKGAGDVLVQIEAMSICETDEKIFDGSTPTKKLPIPIGHEASGVIVDVGDDVKNIVPGDRVLIDPNVNDSTCHLCRSGLSNLCLNGGLMGRDVDGAFQQFLAVPSKNVFFLPRSIPAEIAPLIQPFSTVIHGHRQIEIGPGSIVAVLGLGVVGLLLAQVAKLRGAQVVGVDIAPAKLELARQLGIDVAVNSTNSDPVKEVLSISDGRGAEVVIEAVGVPDLIRKGMQMLRPGGILLQFGVSTKEAAYNMYDAYIKEFTLKATRSSLPQDFQDAIRIVQQGRIDLSYLVSKTFRFEETKEAISFFHDRAKVLKVIIRT